MAELLDELADDPDARRRRTGMIVLVSLLLVVGLLAARQMSRPSAGLCGAAEQQFAELWSVGRQVGLKAALMATDRPYAASTWGATRAIVERYRDGWVAMHTDTCEATHVRGEQSAQLLDLRMACLRDRRQELAALLDLLERNPAQTIERAVEAADSLTPVSRCADLKALPAMMQLPSDAEARQKISALRQRLAEGKALYDAYELERGVEVVSEVVSAAEDLRYWPLIAEARYRLGLLHEGKDRAEQAEITLRRALLDAGAGGHDRIAAAAAVRLVRVSGYQQSDFEQADYFARLARQTMTRLDRHQGLDAALTDHLGLVEFNRGHYGRSVEKHRRAVELAERYRGPDHPLVARSLIRLGTALQEQAKARDAQKHLVRALAINRDHFGPDHPKIAINLERLAGNHYALGDYRTAQRLYQQSLEILRAVDPASRKLAVGLTNHGNLLAALGRTDDALDQYRRALEIYRQDPLPDDERMGLTLLNLGSTLLQQDGPPDAAMDALQEALLIFERMFGRDHPRVVQVLVNMGEWLNARGDYVGAREQLLRMLDISRRVFGENHPQVAFALTGLGRADNGMAAHDRAREHLERALAILIESSLGGPAAAETRFELGTALWALGRDRPRAHRLVSTADQDLKGASSAYRPLVAKVAAWLAAHPLPSSG